MHPTCLCAGQYEGCEHGSVCTEDPGGHKSPDYCVECDKRRIVYMTRQFKRLRVSFSDADNS